MCCLPRQKKHRVFSELCKQNLLNICIGTTFVIAHTAGFVVGFLVKQSWLNNLGNNLIETGKSKIFKRIDSTFICSNTLCFFPDPNIDLQKYHSGKLTIRLNPCFEK